MEHKSGKEFYEMSKKEKEEVYDTPRTLLDRLKEIHGKVNSLIDFINILGKLKSSDFNVWHTKILKETGLNPETFLNEYVILEMTNFYTIVHLEDNDDLPKAPEYWEKLREFRHVVPAHADKNKDFKTYRELRELYLLLDEIGMHNILKDFHNYFVECVRILNN